MCLAVSIVEGGGGARSSSRAYGTTLNNINMSEFMSDKFSAELEYIYVQNCPYIVNTTNNILIH